MTTRPLAVVLAACLAAPGALGQSPAPAPEKPGAIEKPASKAGEKPAEARLKAGDKAPGIKSDGPGSWVRGEPLSALEPGKVTVVEFWATWCPSCREAMPKLARRAKAHRDDLTIIAVASSEKRSKAASPPTAEGDPRLDGVARFAKDREASMPYRVLFDGSRAMANDWIVAAGQKYLPFAFIVDHTGTIAWQGDPRMTEFDAALDRTLRAAAPPPPPKPDPKPDPKKTAPKPARPKR
ncbi:MAG TPA: TlpA disulfide reductase family protein [Phycisphaerales bacterium]|nr:TlpA disulfide reductase family protein [Phycisphaerales bacterium]